MPELRNFGPQKGKNPGLPVNIHGDGFSELKPETVAVKFGSTAGDGTEVKNDQHIQTRLPANLADGAYAIEVSGILQTGQAWKAAFTEPFLAGEEPVELTISDIFPSQVSKANGGDLNIYGYHFKANNRTSTPQVKFNNAMPLGTVVNDSLIQVTAPPHSATGLPPMVTTYKPWVVFSDSDKVESPEALKWV